MLYWAPLHRRELHEEPFTSSKVVGSVSQFLFGNDKVGTQTVTAGRYMAILQNFLLPKLEAFGGLSNNLFFQQNGHSVYAARFIMEGFSNLFRRVI